MSLTHECAPVQARNNVIPQAIPPDLAGNSNSTRREARSKTTLRALPSVGRPDVATAVALALPLLETQQNDD
jgi:hypothetical protein